MNWALMLSLSLLFACGADESTSKEVSDRGAMIVDLGSGMIDLDAGIRLYVGNCEVCHGEEGRGGSSPPINGAALEGRADTTLFISISQGVPGVMPAFGGSLSDDEIRTLISYLRSL